MCGILLFASNDYVLTHSKFRAALNGSRHRGPDNTDLATRIHPSNSQLTMLADGEHENLTSNFFIGHNRLSIVDPNSSSNQPVLSDEKSKALSFNGQFYNFKDFGRGLSRHSDTLTLFELIQTKCMSAFDYVNGPFASIYTDLTCEKLFLSRDRYGKKPLYYFHEGSTLIVSSEIGGIYQILFDLKIVGKKRNVNRSGLAFFLIGKLTPFGSMGADFYSKTQSVPPGQHLVFNLKSGSLKNFGKVRWHELHSSNEAISKLKDEELFELLTLEVNDAVKIRAQGLPEIGLFLSGGIDSSLILGSLSSMGLGQNVRAFSSLLYDENQNLSDDLNRSREVARALQVHLTEVSTTIDSEDGLLSSIVEATTALELPVNFLLSSLPTLQISRSMREIGLKVALDGVGGDEVFGGYPVYASLAIANARHGSLLDAMSCLKGLSRQEGVSVGSLLTLFGRVMSGSLRKRNIKVGMNQSILASSDLFLDNQLTKELFRLSEDKFVRNDLTTVKDRQIFELFDYQIPYYVGVADAFCMANSIENRSPFLDYRLVKFLRMPIKQKFRNGFNKFALRKSMPCNIPDGIRWQKQKAGMGISFKNRSLSGPKIKELVGSSDFVRTLLPHGALDKHLIDEGGIKNQLLSLAVLDHLFGLTLD